MMMVHFTCDDADSALFDDENDDDHDDNENDDEEDDDDDGIGQNCCFPFSFLQMFSPSCQMFASPESK